MHCIQFQTINQSNVENAKLREWSIKCKKCKKESEQKVNDIGWVFNSFRKIRIDHVVHAADRLTESWRLERRSGGPKLWSRSRGIVEPKEHLELPFPHPKPPRRRGQSPTLIKDFIRCWLHLKKDALPRAVEWWRRWGRSSSSRVYRRASEK